ncbi:hypothetical protein HON36_01195 [Candidatus Parcubacteria bacterium]|jgi:hypothetical protein|nr:hypothetical protein [Candidatus Parcubacteria bacterium]MBT7228021.1 hypothetical protein [Candidatus Parcubacteria bacterium]
MVIKIILLALPVLIGIAGFFRWWIRKSGEMFGMGIGLNVVSLALGILLFFFGSIESPWSLLGATGDIALCLSTLVCYFDGSNTHDATDGRF